MAFKSKAQKERFERMLKEGKISKEYFDSWAVGTKANLPDKIKSDSKPKALPPSVVKKVVRR